MKAIYCRFALVLSMCLTVACGGGGSDGPDYSLSVVRTSFDGAELVDPVNSSIYINKIEVHFNRSLKTDNLFDANGDVQNNLFYVRNLTPQKADSPEYLPGRLVYDAAGNKLVYTLSAYLEYRTEYEVFVSRQVKSIHDTSLDEDYSFTFTTQNEVELSLVSAFPEAGSMVGANELIILQFNAFLKDSGEAYNAQDYLTVSGPSGPVAGSVTIDNDKMMFRPTHNLGFGSLYRIYVSHELRGIRDEALLNDQTWEFQVEEPLALNFYPQRVDAKRNASIYIEFNFDIEPASAQDKLYLIKAQKDLAEGEEKFNEMNKVPGQVEASGSKLFFKPNEELDLDTEYRLVFVGDIQATGGQPSYLESIIYDFKTEPPRMADYAPQGQEVPVDTEIVFYYNYDVNPESVRANGKMKLVNVNQPSQSWEFSPHNAVVDNKARTVTFPLPLGERLEYNTEYAAELSGEISGYKEDEKTSGNFRWSFVTERKEIKILSASPKDEKKNVSPWTDIVIDFSYPVDPYVLENNFTIKDRNGGYSYYGIFTYSQDDTRVTVRLPQGESYDPGRRYRVEIAAAAIGQKGEELFNKYQIDFTVDELVVEGVSYDPSDKEITIEFNQDIERDSLSLLNYYNQYGTVGVYDDDGYYLDGTVSLDYTEERVVIHLNEALQAGVTYSVVVTSELYSEKSQTFLAAGHVETLEIEALAVQFITAPTGTGGSLKIEFWDWIDSADDVYVIVSDYYGDLDTQESISGSTLEVSAAWEWDVEYSVEVYQGATLIRTEYFTISSSGDDSYSDEYEDYDSYGDDSLY